MKIYLVGGAVRDNLLRIATTEKDWVVVGATVDEMLARGYRPVGKDFPVFLHPDTQEEYALARTERKVGKGYTGFTFNAHPEVTLEEDLKRRDLTINAMAQDPESGQLIDPFGGQEDLNHQLLRHVSNAFSEDPVRILRVGRFAARYAHLGFKVAPETLELMKQMVKVGEVDALVPERVWKELERALTEQTPEAFFKVLHECGALVTLFPGVHYPTALQPLAVAKEDSVIRFSVLVHSLTENELKIMADRYKIPLEHRELALLVIKHQGACREKNQLNTNAILTILSSTDAFRRVERFEKFLRVIDVLGYKDSAVLLKAGYDQVKNINLQAILNEGLKGAEIATRIQAERARVLEAWLASGSARME